MIPLHAKIGILGCDTLPRKRWRHSSNAITILQPRDTQHSSLLHSPPCLRTDGGKCELYKHKQPLRWSSSPDPFGVLGCVTWHTRGKVEPQYNSHTLVIMPTSTSHGSKMLAYCLSLSLSDHHRQFYTFQKQSDGNVEGSYVRSSLFREEASELTYDCDYVIPIVE